MTEALPLEPRARREEIVHGTIEDQAVPADVAVEVGLANRVVADGTSVTEAVALAQRLAVQPRQALRDTKRAVNKHIERALVDVLDFAISAEAVASASPEHAAIIESIIAMNGPSFGFTGGFDRR